MYFYITNAEDYEPREKTRRIPKRKKYKLGWFEDQDWQTPVLSFLPRSTTSMFTLIESISILVSMNG
jgi:hypothetical protein